MFRRILLMAGILLVPVLLALAGSLLAAPAGPPEIDRQPVRLTAGPDGKPAPALEPEPVPQPAPGTKPGTKPGATPSAPPAKPVPSPSPSATPSGELPAPPAPVLPPVVIDDDDDAGEVDD